MASHHQFPLRARGCRPYATAVTIIVLGVTAPARGYSADPNSQPATPPPTPPAKATSVPGLGNKPCTRIEIEGDTIDRTRTVWSLAGNAAVRCESLRLWADTIDVAVSDDGEFGGAVARGNVLLVDGNRLLTCETITLNADRIRAHMSDATVHVKAGTEVMPVSNVPIGRDRAVLHGASIERETENQLSVDDADFTLCDCGDDTPSWRISGETIDATLNERVTIWWPMFWISPFGIDTMIPVTPPLAPLSLPLRTRATGFLPPLITFRRMIWPTVDLPFFVPLGDSWDVTLTPGLRTDWSTAHVLGTPQSWGASRLATRLRYAPTVDTDGSLTVDWTHDGQHGAAIAAFQEPGSPYWRLVDRVSVSAQHRTDFTDSLRLLVRGQWISDDKYLNDFGIALNDRAAVYIPSRAQLQWRTDLFAAYVAGDYFLRSDNTPGSFSNLEQAERNGPQRGPALHLTLVPQTFGPGIHLAGEASLERYGPWGAVSSSKSPTLFVTRAAPALTLARDVGPLRLRAHTALDAAVLSGTGGINEPHRALALIADADLWMRAARRFGSFSHVVTPSLKYLAVPWRDGATLANLTFRTLPEGDDPEAIAAEIARMIRVSALDAQLRRDRTSHQALVSLDQSLWKNAGKSTSPLATLKLSQPFDLVTMEPLASEAALEINSASSGSVGLHANIYLPGLAHPQSSDAATLDPNRALRELRVWFSPPKLGPLSASIAYNRFTKEDGRLLRSIYEIEAPANRSVPGATWVEYLDGSLSLNLKNRLALTYSTSYCLLPPGEIASETVPGFSGHSVSISYHSPCECWDVRLFGSKAAGQEWREIQAGLVISVGGYSVGSAR